MNKPAAPRPLSHSERANVRRQARQLCERTQPFSIGALALLLKVSPADLDSILASEVVAGRLRRIETYDDAVQYAGPLPAVLKSTTRTRTEPKPANEPPAYGHVPWLGSVLLQPLQPATGRVIGALDEMREGE